MMKYHSNLKTKSTFSWLAYGSLSVCMLVVAAVSATVGQDGMGRSEALSAFETDGFGRVQDKELLSLNAN